jgi:hypothetical protein
MGFTVQLMSNGGASTSNEPTWAVLLNHEHIMYVGTYQQCEDWLDLYGVQEIAAKATFPCDRTCDPCGKSRGMIAEWFNRLVQRRFVHNACQRTVAFLTDNSGHIGLVESAGLAIAMAAVYLMLTTWTLAWNQTIIYDSLVRASNAPRQVLAGPADRTCSPFDQQSLDIACDLGQ